MRHNDSPVTRSHYLPRTGTGWITLVTLIALFSLAEPPLVFVIANRVEPWLFGMPFLYAYLLIIYTAMISVMIWARRRGL